MVKNINIALEAEEYFNLKSIKNSIEFADKKNLTWKEFLCDFIISLFETANRETVDGLVKRAYNKTKAIRKTTRRIKSK